MIKITFKKNKIKEPTISVVELDEKLASVSFASCHCSN